MQFIVFLHFAIFFQFFELYQGNNASNYSSNELCLPITSSKCKRSEEVDYQARVTEESEKFFFLNSSNSLKEKEIFSFENFYHTSNIGKNLDSRDYKLQINTTDFPKKTLENLIYFSSDYKYAGRTNNSEDIKNVTDVELELLNNNFENSSITAVYIPSTTLTETSLFVPVTQMPLSESNFLFKKNYNKERSICFCDLKVNECDINCCCDEDCSLAHLKVFVKCINVYDHLVNDGSYCFRNYSVFASNTFFEMVQESTGLFCITRQNLKISMVYETKSAVTSLDAFSKIIPKHIYGFSYKTEKIPETVGSYLAGLPVWTIFNEKLLPLKIPFSTVGLLCNSEISIKYLIDQTTKCYIQPLNNECESKRIREMLHYLRNVDIIANPGYNNVTQKFNSSKICKSEVCVAMTSYLCHPFGDAFECLKVSEDATQFFGCWNVLSNIEYEVLHNGSNGIIKVEARVWIKKLPKTSSEVLLPLITNVRYHWVDSTKRVFRRSGNPGYLSGKPIMAGRKIHNVTVSSQEKEAIELPLNPNNWLSVLGSKKGLCSSKNQIPVNFRENGQFSCSLELGKNNFTKEKCLELQTNIFKLLLGPDIINATKENYYNKFVAIFGDSRTEETRDWVQVIIDLFPLTSSQVSFKSNHYDLVCKNIITDFFIDIVYSNIGSVLAPQAKILGVHFHFGKHKDLIYFCDSPNCESPFLTQNFKLSSSVRFIDVTKRPVDAFAEPLHLEAKLPHNFFYPFFSKASKSSVFNKFFLILILLTTY